VIGLTVVMLFIFSIAGPAQIFGIFLDPFAQAVVIKIHLSSLV
jgi:hypothetical protein